MKLRQPRLPLAVLAVIAAGLGTTTQVVAGTGDRLGVPVPVLSAPQPSSVIPDRVTVASSAQHGFAVVWDEFTRAGRRVSGRRYSADGVPSGDQFPIDARPPAGGIEEPLSAVIAPTGELIVAWLGNFAEGCESDRRFCIRARIFNADGSPRGNTITVAVDPAPRTRIQEGEGLESPVVAAGDAGQFTVAWTSYRFLNSPQGRSNPLTLSVTELRSRRFTMDGVAMTPEQVLSSRSSVLLTDTIASGLRAVTAEDGGFVLGYRPQTAADLVLSPFVARRYDGSGRPFGLPQRLGTRGDGALITREEEFGLGFAGNGDLVLAYTVPLVYLERPERVLVQRYSRLGFALGPAIEVARRGGGTNGFRSRITLQVAPIPSGGFVIAWPDNAAGGSFGRYYAADGSPLSEAFRITDKSLELSATTDPQGNLLAVWGSTCAPNPDPIAVCMPVPNPPQLFLGRFQGP